MRAAVVSILGFTLLGAACSHSTSVSPSSSTTTTTSTTPTTSELFTGTLAVGGFQFYSFNIVTNGTVNVTLNSVSGAGVPATVQLSLGIGQPAATDCQATTTVTAAAGTNAQLSGTFGPGLFCVRVSDVGNLFGPAVFSITIAHS